MNPLIDNANAQKAPVGEKNKKSKPCKVLRIVIAIFGIISILSIVAWLTFFFLYGLLPAKVNGDFVKFFNLWIYPHVYEMLRLFLLKSYGVGPNDSPNFYFTYIGFALAILLLAIIIVSLIFAIKFKKKKYLPYLLVVIFASVAVLEFLVYYEPLYKEYLVFVFHDKTMAANILFTWIVFLTAVLSYVTMVLTFILWIIYVCKSSKGEKAPETKKDEARPVEAKVAPVAKPAEAKPVPQVNVQPQAKPVQQAKPAAQPAKQVQPQAKPVAPSNKPAEAKPAPIVKPAVATNANKEPKK